jgi:flagellar motor switch/type III secretory pathway protein FliN
VTEGTDPLLSEEETSALLDAMRENERITPEHKPTQLVDPERELRALLVRADASAPMLASAVRAQLLKQIARGVDVMPLPAEIAAREVLMAALDPYGLRYRVSAGDEALGLLAIDSSLVRFVVDRCMGAPETSQLAPTSTVARFSDLDRRIFAPLPLAASASLTALLGRKATIAPAQDEAASASSRFEPLLRLTWRLCTPLGELGQITVALSAGAFGVQAPAVRDREPMRERIVQAEIELSAVLGTAPSTVRELLALATGDVLRLSTSPSDPVAIYADDVVLARGVPVVRSGNIAVEITERS